MNKRTKNVSKIYILTSSVAGSFFLKGFSARQRTKKAFRKNYNQIHRSKDQFFSLGSSMTMVGSEYKEIWDILLLERG